MSIHQSIIWLLPLAPTICFLCRQLKRYVTAKLVSAALVLSRLVYCNTVLVRLPVTTLQRVLPPVLHQIHHWLPVTPRIRKFKLMCLYLFADIGRPPARAQRPVLTPVADIGLTMQCIEDLYFEGQVTATSVAAPGFFP